MIPLQLTLKIYHSNRVRLEMVKLPIPTNLTRWINEAMAKRLDSDHPETIGLPEMMPPESASHERIMERAREIAQASKPMDFMGPYRVKYGQNAGFLALAEGQRREMKKRNIALCLEDRLEIVAKKSDLELSEEEKVSIMAEYHKAKQSESAQETSQGGGEIPESVRGKPREYAKWRDEEDARLKAEESNFWGDAV